MVTGEKVVKGIIYNATGNTFVQLVGIITSIIIARVLGPEIQGTYVLILSIPLTLNTFITLGWNQGLNRYIPALRGENIEGLIAPILRRAFVIRFILSILAAMFLILFSDLIESLFNIEGWLDWPVLMLISIYLVIVNISSILNVVLTVHYEQKWLNITNALSVSIMLLGILGLFYFEAMNVVNVLFVTLISQIIVIICLTVVYKRSISLPRDYNPDELTEYIKRFAKYSTVMYLIQLAGFILAYRSDIYFLAYYLGTTSVSFYSIANGLVEQSTSIFGKRATGPMLVGTMVEKFAREGKDMLSTVFYYNIQYVFLYITPIIFGGILLARDIIDALYGALYMPVVPLLTVIFAVRFFLSFGGAFSGVLLALEKPQYLLWTKIISIANIPLNILLIPRIGIMGAVIATAITTVTIMSIETYLTLRIIKLRFPVRNILKMLLCNAIMLAIVFLFRELVTINLIALKLVIEIILGALIYVFSVINLNPLDKEIWGFMPEQLVGIVNKIRFSNREL